MSGTKLKDRIRDEINRKLRKRRRMRADERIDLLKRVGRTAEAQRMEGQIADHFDRLRRRAEAMAETTREQDRAAAQRKYLTREKADPVAPGNEQETGQATTTS